MEIIAREKLNEMLEAERTEVKSLLESIVSSDTRLVNAFILLEASRQLRIHAKAVGEIKALM